jgi:uncharacterized NAD-dependent epimerase/dehydratase family protein
MSCADPRSASQLCQQAQSPRRLEQGGTLPGVSTRERRLVLLAEERFTRTGAKTAVGLIRYGTDLVVAVIDSTRAGSTAGAEIGAGGDIPVVATLEEALAKGPNTLIVGVSTRGGDLPPAFRPMILAAIEAGLDIESGLHEFISEDPEFAAAAARRGVRLVDHRAVEPEWNRIVDGRDPGVPVIATVGTDCNTGKMTASLEIARSLAQLGVRAGFAPTGQTGRLVAGWGVAVDRVISDFLAGASELLVRRAAEGNDLVIVEGQGSIDHPTYSGVTLGLLHGSRPDLLILCHQSGRAGHNGYESFPIRPLTELVEMYEQAAAWVRPARTVGVALNTSSLDETGARQAIADAAAETGLPTTDPVRFGAGPLAEAIRVALPKVAVR